MKYNKIRPTITASLAKLRNPEPMMPQWKNEKDSIFKQGQIMTLAAASVIMRELTYVK
jgi:hypothetical protein